MRSFRSLAPIAASITLVAAPWCAASSQTRPGSLRLARLLSEGAVLQRGTRIPIWGWATPRAPVRVELDGRSAAATADGAGKWRALLAAVPAGGPYTLTVRSGDERVDVRNVLVGDVWVASGQSNMEFQLSAADRKSVV